MELMLLYVTMLLTETSRERKLKMKTVDCEIDMKTDGCGLKVGCGLSGTSSCSRVHKCLVVLNGGLHKGQSTEYP